MIEKLQQIINDYNDTNAKLASPEISSNPQKFKELSIKLSELETINAIAKSYIQKTKNLEEAQEVLESDSDPELKEMAELEIEEIKPELKKLEKEIEVELIPKDPNDKKNVIIEIRAGAGGDEASLFAADLFRMYQRFAENNSFKTEIINSNRNEIGGYKEISLGVTGQNAYKLFKYESGVHRVQRVPETEKQGRIHTSTATVAVLPEAEEVDLEINPKDLRIDTYASSGKGGQSVNTTDSAVRIVHIPTNTIVTCQDERSQHKNKAKAMKVLRSRLLAVKEEEEAKRHGDLRKNQVGTGDRSEKIRTYNFPQDRITDHRIKKTVNNMETFLAGNIQEMITALQEEDQKMKLEHAQQS